MTTTKNACGVFVDLQKAFDTVNHEMLIGKPDNYGIRSTANNCFSSYLKNRSRFVSILGYESNTQSINHGVPQGSVLGLLLFLIYINDLHFSIKNSKVYNFADDTNILNINDSKKKKAKRSKYRFKNIVQLATCNQISINYSKTKIIFFHKTREKTPYIKIKMNGHRIYPSTDLKYLGVYLDETLNGGYHCKNLIKKLKRVNGMLCKTRHYININDLKMQIFSSHLVYGCQIWGQHIN